MAVRHRIECINKSDRANPHERILNVGGSSGGTGGGRWRITQHEAIAGIEDGRWAFYVERGGRTAEVIVAVSQYDNKYLKTVADGLQPDNLLALPECPR